MNLPEGMHVPQVFLKPRFCILKGAKRDPTQMSTDVFNDLFELLGQLVVGERLIIFGAAGSGKSTLSANMTEACINKVSTLQRYEYVYLIVARNVRNHSGPLEATVCNVLGLSCHGDVRRCFKFNSCKSLIIIDGFDEVSERDRHNSILNDVISGKEAARATVVVTSRPDAMTVIADLIGSNDVVTVLTALDPEDVNMYIKLMFKDKEQIVRNILRTAQVPEEILRVPLFLTLMCILCEYNFSFSTSEVIISELNSTSSVLATFWGILIAIKEERGGRDMMVFKSLSQKNMSTALQRLLHSVCHMCFESLERGIHTFTEDLLAEYMIDLVDLTGLGPVDVQLSGNKGMVFIHSLFQEYAAAMYLAKRPSELHLIMKKLNISASSLTASLAPYNNVLLFATHINSNLLTELASRMYLPLVITSSECPPNYELSYLASLLHECTDRETRRAFISKMYEMELGEANELQKQCKPKIHTSPYIAMLDIMGMSGCLGLQKRLYKDQLVTVGDAGTLCSVVDSLVICDTLLLSCLPAITLQGVTSLVIRYCAIDILTTLQSPCVVC